MTSGDIERELIDVATSLEQAAQAFKAKNYSAAEPIYRRALSVLERIYGTNDPDTLSCLQSLGDIYFQMGRYTEAMPHYKRLLSIGEQRLGKNHPDVINLVLRLASTYQQLGLNNDADTLYRRANAMSSQLTASPPQRPQRPSSTYNQAPVQQTQRPSSTYNQAPAQQPQRPSSTYNQAPAQQPSRPSSTNSRMPGAQVEEPNPFDESSRRNPGARNAKRPTRFDTEAPAAPKAKDIKKADAAKEEARQALLIAIQRSSGVVISFVVVGVLIFCGYFVLNALSSSSSSTNGAASNLRGIAYKTSDGQIDLVVSAKGEPTYRVGSQAYACSITSMGPDFLDFKDSIFSSLINKEVWFEETPSGLIREDGTILYSKNGPEMQVVRQLEAVAKTANNWFLARREYPKQNGDIQLGPMGVNPVSQRPETPSVDHIEAPNMDVQEYVDVPNSNMTLEKVLASSGSAIWLKESPPVPGGIHCLNALHMIQTGDVKEFFAHGFDRNGKLISTSRPGEIYLVAMYNGKQSVQAPLQAPKPGRPPKICIVKLPPNTPLWFLHYFTPIACLCFAMIFFMAGKATKVQSDSSAGSVGTRLGFVFFFIAALWIGSYFIP